MARLFTLAGFVTLPKDAKVPDGLSPDVLGAPNRIGGNLVERHYMVSASHCDVEPKVLLAELRDALKAVGATSMTAQLIWGMDEVDYLILGSPSWTDNVNWADENNEKNLAEICKSRR